MECQWQTHQYVLSRPSSHTLTPSPDTVLDTCHTQYCTGDRTVVSACCGLESRSPASGQPRASDFTMLALPWFLH